MDLRNEFTFPLHSSLFFYLLKVKYDNDNKDKRSNKFSNSSCGIYHNFKGNLSLKSNYLHAVLYLSEHSEIQIFGVVMWLFRLKVVLLHVSCQFVEASTS